MRTKFHAVEKAVRQSAVTDSPIVFWEDGGNGKEIDAPTSRFSEGSMIMPQGTELCRSNCWCVALRKPTVFASVENGRRVASLMPAPAVGLEERMRGGFDWVGSLEEERGLQTRVPAADVEVMFVDGAIVDHAGFEVVAGW